MNEGKQMINKQQTKTNTAQKAQDKKLPQLQPLKLEQLDGVAGGPSGVNGADM